MAVLSRIQAAGQWAFLRLEAVANRVFGERLNPLYYLGAISTWMFWLVVGTGLYLYVFFDKEFLQTARLDQAADVRVLVARQRDAGAAHGAQRRGPLGIGFDLAAQARDADVDRAVERLPLAVARVHQQLVARQHAVRVGQEDAHQVVLHRRDRHFLAAGGEVEQPARLELDLAAPVLGLGARTRGHGRVAGDGRDAGRRRQAQVAGQELEQVGGVGDAVQPAAPGLEAADEGRRRRPHHAQHGVDRREDARDAAEREAGPRRDVPVP